jgi:DNA-binding transcriptional MerR regulator
MMRSIPASLAADLTGLSLRQLRYLQQTALVTPTVRSRPGTGKDILYAASDLPALMIIERVRAVCGQEIRTERLRLVLTTASERNRGSGRHLVLDGESCWLQDGELEPLLTRLPGAALILDLEVIEAEAELRLRRAGLGPLSAPARAA